MSDYIIQHNIQHNMQQRLLLIMTAVTPPRKGMQFFVSLSLFFLFQTHRHHILGKITLTHKPAAVVQLSTILDQVDNLTAIVLQLCDFLGVPGPDDKVKEDQTYTEKLIEVGPAMDPQPVEDCTLPHILQQNLGESGRLKPWTVLA